MNSGDQVSCYLRFCNIRGCTGTERCVYKIPVFVNGEEHNPRPGVTRLEPRRRLQPIQPRHGDVNHQDLRIERCTPATASFPFLTEPTISKPSPRTTRTLARLA